MSNDPKVLAVRRNLQPGYIAFKQEGCRLLYTLDNVTWRLAFDYSLCDTQSTLPQITKIQQFVSQYGMNASPTVGAGEKQLGTVGRVIQACELSYWIVENYNEVIRLAVEAKHDNQQKIGAALLGLGAAVLGIAAAAVTGGLSLGISATALSMMSAGMAAGAAAWNVQYLSDNIAPLNDEQKAALRCCIKNRIVTDFTRTGLSSITCDEIPSEHLAAFNEIMARGETWAGVVLASQEITASSGRGCCADDGCWYIVPSSCTTLNGPINGHAEYDGASLRTHNRYPPQSSSNVAKYIEATWTLETPILLNSVEFDTFTTGVFNNNSVETWVTSPGYTVPPSVPLVAGNKTWRFSYSPTNKLAYGIAIRLKVVTAGNYHIETWKACNVWLNAIRVCGTELT